MKVSKSIASILAVLFIIAAMPTNLFALENAATEQAIVEELPETTAVGENNEGEEPLIYEEDGTADNAENDEGSLEQPQEDTEALEDEQATEEVDEIEEISEPVKASATTENDSLIDLYSLDIINNTDKLEAALIKAVAEGGRQVIALTGQDGVFIQDRAIIFRPTGTLEVVFTNADGGHLVWENTSALHLDIRGGASELTFTFENVTVDGGKVAGGMYYREGTGSFTLNGAYFTNCVNGAVDVAAKVTEVNLVNSLFEENTSGQGGAIRASAAVTVVNVTDTTIQNNTATGAGGGISSGATVLYSGAKILNNSGTNGGGVYGANTNGTIGRVTMYAGAVVDGNVARSTGNPFGNGGGGISADEVFIYGGEITNNQAGMAGGGIANGHTRGLENLIIENATISGNTATMGGGVFSKVATTIVNSNFNNNTATAGEGGGIYVFDYATTLRDCVFTNNTSHGYGGGAVAVANRAVHVYGGEYRNNHCDGHGGALYASAASSTVDGATFSGNTASVGFYWNVYDPITTSQKGVQERYDQLITNVNTFSASPSHLPEFNNLYNNYDFQQGYLNPTYIFDANGGAWADGATWQQVYTPTANTTIEPNGLPELLGHDIAYWYMQKHDGTHFKFVPGVDITLIGNVYVYAHWQLTNYALTYDLAGGSAQNPGHYTIESEDFTLAYPTRTGYIFTGWTGGEYDAPTMAVTIRQGSTGAKHFTAHWKKDEAPETSKPETSGTDSSISSNTVSSGQESSSEATTSRGNSGGNGGGNSGGSNSSSSVVSTTSASSSSSGSSTSRARDTESAAVVQVSTTSSDAVEIQDNKEEADDEELPIDSVNLDGGGAPLGGWWVVRSSWAVVNLLLAVASLLVVALALVRKRHKKQLVQIVGALAMVLLFLLTQDITKEMKFVDWFTIPMALVLAVQCAWMLFAQKRRENN